MTERLEAAQTVIDNARTWDDLTRLVAQVQARFARGSLDAGTVEAVARRCVVRARQIPSSDPRVP